MGKFKVMFQNYLDNQGSKPLLECPFEVQLFAFGMYLGASSSNKKQEEFRDKLFSEMAEYYEEELGAQISDDSSETYN